MNFIPDGMKKKNKEAILDLALTQGLIPPFNHNDPDTAIAVMEAVYRGGLRIFEFTNRSEDALDTFLRMVKHARKHMPDLVLGIGTIMNTAQAKAFHAAGAQFIVAPNLNKSVGQYCKKEKLFWCPGASTPSEVITAMELGAALVKLFPAEILGPVFIKALKGPCPWVKVMPSGGVTLDAENIRSWFAAGADCVAIGSNLFTKEIMAAKDYAALEERTRKMLNLIASIK